MKKLLLSLFAICLFLTVSGVCNAQIWKATNQATVSWDAVTVPSGTVTYKTYYKPAAGGTAIYFSTVSTTQAVITFTIEGRYFLGVSSVRNIDGSEIESSTISWSDDPLACQNGQTFGIVYYIPPAAPGGMR